MAATDWKFNEEKVWDMDLAFAYLHKLGEADTKRTAERRVASSGFMPTELTEELIELPNQERPIVSVLKHEADEARKNKKLVLFIQLGILSSNKKCLFANDARGARYWVPFTGKIDQALEKLQSHLAKKLFLIPHLDLAKELEDFVHPMMELPQYSFPKKLKLPPQDKLASKISSHLKELEAESIFILREAVANAENPVMLYSLGKDSSVMLHLARKAFYPAPPPFPLLHVDTRWKFQEMYAFRDFMAQESNMKLLLHINPDAIEKNINPFDHGSSLHTDITKTEGLKQALNQYKFDVIFGGARRDEEKSRAKERIFSFRNENHVWDPKNQRPELWNLFNTKKNKGESIRVFPLSNWTELDIWQYIMEEQIPIVPLYFAKKRPVVVRDGMIILVDDNRMKFLPDEKIEIKNIRFRTLGCYPLTGAIESNATTLREIVEEITTAKISERQGRAIDSDSNASMEKKKKEGYF